MKYVLMILLILAIGCNTKPTKLSKQRKTWGFEHWEQDFKDYTLCQCLIKGYGDRDIEVKLGSIDKSFASPVNRAIFDSTTQAIIRPIIKTIEDNSLKSTTTVSENAAGKQVFNQCLKFYKSKKLEDIAKTESKKWESINDIDSLIYKRMPSF
jgi:hypothetical protein